jgi:hypothetical protein
MIPFQAKLKKCFYSAVLLASVGFAQFAQAELITIEYSARVTELNATTPQGLDRLNGLFRAGQVLTGSYSFESTTRDSAADPQSGLYFNAGNSLVLSNGTNTFNAAEVGIEISNLSAVDIYRVVSNRVTPGIVNGLNSFAIILALTDNVNATALRSDALLASAPNLGAFNIASLSLIFTEPGSPTNVANVLATVTRLQVAPATVPLPSSVLLVIFGLLGLVRSGAIRLNRRKSLALINRINCTYSVPCSA